LNSPERVKALYQINEQRKAYRDQMKHCKKAVDSLTKIAVKLGDRSNEYADHNLDLQSGLLGLIEQVHEKDVEIAKLKATKKKQFGIGLQAGYNPMTGQPYGGGGVSWNPFRF